MLYIYTHITTIIISINEIRKVMVGKDGYFGQN